MFKSFEDALAHMTPEVCANLRRAVELGRWPDGRALSTEQKELCLQAVIAWEAKHLPEEERMGYVAGQCKSDSNADEQKEQAVTIRGSSKTLH